MDVEAEFSGLVTEVAHVGSRVSCNPPPMDTDDDYLVFAPAVEPFILAARAAGFEDGGSKGMMGIFKSLRLDEVNLIVTKDRLFFDKFMLATRVATRLNLMSKDDRIMLFAAIIDGKGPSDGR